MPTYMDPPIATRRSLLSRLKDWDDQKSWREFFDTYWKLIYASALKAGLTHAEAEDVVQETLLTVIKKIRDLKYDPALGSFKGWLLNTTRWRIQDQFRKRQTGPPPLPHSEDSDRRTATIERIPDPLGFDLDAVWEEQWRKNLMAAAIERIKRRIPPKQFQLFDLYVLKNWPVRQVAQSLGVNIAHVYLAKHRVTSMIQQEVKRLERQPLCGPT